MMTDGEASKGGMITDGQDEGGQNTDGEAGKGGKAAIISLQHFHGVVLL